MAERDSWAVMNGASRVVDAEDARIAIGGLWTPGSTAIAARQGIRPGPGTPFKVNALGTPGANVTVDLGQMLLTATRGFGSYVATLDTTKTVPILDVPADPTNQRNDLIIATQSDTFYADGSTAYTVRRVQGTPNASPVDPSLAAFPDRILLARVRVTANTPTITNAMIDDLRPGWSVGLGGVLPVNNVTDRGTLTHWAGLAIYRLDKGWVEISDGTAWRVPGFVVAGALADITNPLTGQLVTLSTDSMVYRWTGAAWLGVEHTGPGGGMARYNQTSPQAGLSVAATWVKVAYPNAVFTHSDITQTNSTDYVVNRTGTWRVTARSRISPTTVDGVRFLFGVFTTANALSGTNPMAVSTTIETDAQAWATNISVTTEECRISSGSSISIALRKDGTRVGSVASAGGGANSASETSGFPDQNCVIFQWVGP